MKKMDFRWREIRLSWWCISSGSEESGHVISSDDDDNGDCCGRRIDIHDFKKFFVEKRGRGNRVFPVGNKQIKSMR